MTRPLNSPPQPSAAVAVLFQAGTPPPQDGIVKPPKPGGYVDSSADIAFNLNEVGVNIVTPSGRPNPAVESDWSFPDTAEGIESALRAGAGVVWANTVLHAAHPLVEFHRRGARIVGQDPAKFQKYDDKSVTNEELRAAGCRVASGIIVGRVESPGTMALSDVTEHVLTDFGLTLPAVVKPLRGRGSEGVARVNDLEELVTAARTLFSAKVRVGDHILPRYGTRVMVEEFLPGMELTITVMPPGEYEIRRRSRVFEKHWALPAVKRTGHDRGIAPYSGVVAVTANSELLPEAERADDIEDIEAQCCSAAAVVGALAPIRIDCRRSVKRDLRLFDLNMKPNMTGPGRPGREAQDSLSSIAAGGIGWTYQELLLNMLRQAW